MNYYNEFDPKAAAWLRELIKQRLIAPGEVDERSISDVQPHELSQFTQCHFFAGIGGWSFALRLAGWPDERPVWTGSCPCQPLSSAGLGLGHVDKRHVWPAFYGLIDQRRPAAIFGEQVAGKDGREWFAGVRADLEGMGYACGGADLCSASVGAPNIRQRLYWLADADGHRCDQGRRGESAAGNDGAVRDGGVSRVVHAKQSGLEGHAGSGADGSAPIAGPGESGGMGDADSRGLESGGREESALPSKSGFWSLFDILPCLDGKTRRIEPGSFPLVAGISDRVVRLRGYGNAINPQLAADFIKVCDQILT